MSAMISGTLMSGGMHPIPAILITLVACLLVGVLNGMLVGKFQLPPFIATLGTMFVARGVAYMVNGNRNTNAIASGIGQEMGDKFQNFFYYGDTLGLYNTFWIAMVLFAAFFFLLSKTRTGRHIYAIGSNADAAKLSGVSVVATVTKAYLVAAFCSFVVGLILCAQASMGNMEAGNTYEMYAVAAGVIGGISPLGGTGLLLGTLGGAAVWQTLENGLNMIGAQVGIQRIVIGVIVVFAVLLDVVFRRGIFSRKTTKKTNELPAGVQK
jgi:ribose transport system permease protein